MSDKQIIRKAEPYGKIEKEIVMALKQIRDELQEIKFAFKDLVEMMGGGD
jgi:hypothetical protein